MEEKSAPPFVLPCPAQDDILDVELILSWAPKKKLKRKPTRSPPPPVPCASGYRYTNRRATWFSIDLSYRVLDDLKGIICYIEMQVVPIGV
jgi:hypothetical protein